MLFRSRHTDEGDNRFNKITITEKGNRVVEQSKRIFEMADKKILDGFTEEEKRTLSVLLQKLNDNLDKMEEEIRLGKERT